MSNKALLQTENTYLRDRLKTFEQKTLKLKQLLLLIDPVVSDVATGDTQIKQWEEFIRCFPDEEWVLG